MPFSQIAWELLGFCVTRICWGLCNHFVNIWHPSKYIFGWRNISLEFLEKLLPFMNIAKLASMISWIFGIRRYIFGLRNISFRVFRKVVSLYKYHWTCFSLDSYFNLQPVVHLFIVMEFWMLLRQILSNIWFTFH